MKTTFTTSALFTLLPAALADVFGGMAVRSASPIHFNTVSANGGTFWLQKPTSTYCPEGIDGLTCPVGNNQTLFAGGEGTLALSVVVPGGQQVYIAPDGKLSFTQAHSAYIPTGSIRDGFSRDWRPAQNLGFLQWTNGFVACPANGTSGPYQIYGARDDVTLPENCLGFSMIATNSSGVGAWQYA
ncbi:hypothetical protein LTS18_007237 [Coniosporium uncinatum]|uniref:Uncharacterized protein n=1 Tax=Coniosporium uncinatum TaxID=93489 RepID=A0ACC3DPT8_9PEZI|nr:hypothetical protein LTS18_007237 [Coniosporium uncinatum]